MVSFQTHGSTTVTVCSDVPDACQASLGASVIRTGALATGENSRS